MKQYIPILKETTLFAGVSETEIATMLPCLQAHLTSFLKGEYVFQEGDHLDKLAILVKGSLHIQNDDYWGNRSIINILTEGDLFGESFAVPKSTSFPYDVIAMEDCDVIFFDTQKILTTCSTACQFHALIVRNLFFAISAKNRFLTEKLSHMSKRSTREKLISYLSAESKKHGSATFTIPFNRQQLADFLFVDRSAMSNELCKMRDAGLLEFKKNHFTLHHSTER